MKAPSLALVLMALFAISGCDNSTADALAPSNTEDSVAVVDGRTL